MLSASSLRFEPVPASAPRCAAKAGIETSAPTILRYPGSKTYEFVVAGFALLALLGLALGALGGAALEELRFEGYGPHGVAIIVDTLTDNRNRTSGEVRNLFSRAGGNLGTTGSVAWMFTRQGQIVIDANGRDPDEIGLEAIELGASDARIDGKTVDVVTDPPKLEVVQQALKKKGYKIDSAEVTMNASQLIPLNETTAPSILKLLDALEEHDDVQSVYSNMDVPADVMERISERV